MNKNIIIAVVVGVVLLLLMGASGFAGYKWKAADYAETVAALNVEIYEQGVKLQNDVNTKAELNRKLKVSNRGKSDAIKLNDHNSDKITRLQTILNASRRELEGARADNNRLIVLNVDAVNRVYNEARNACDGLAESNDTPVVSAPISQFTGDSVAAVIRYTVARYCEVATDYNSLYEHSERLLAQ